MRRIGLIRERCPKCGGNVYIDKDFNGWYLSCLQCGYNQDLQEQVAVADNKVLAGVLQQKI